MIYIFKNDYEIKNDYVIIFIKRRNGEIFKTLIDLEDLEKIKKYNSSWHLMWNKNTQSYYARSTVYEGMFNGKPKYGVMFLHRFVMDGKKGDYIDHKNHNTLDNRKNNLKITTNDINLVNRHGENRNNTSGYRNVSWSKTYNKWLVQLQINGKNKILGKFDKVDEAGIFAKEMRLKHYDKKYNI